MTHDKKLQYVKKSFSPKSLEVEVMQEDKVYLTSSLEENHQGTENDSTKSPAQRNMTPSLWIFGLMYSTPCV